MLICKKEYKKM